MADVSKASGYAITGASVNTANAPKFVAYAVTGQGEIREMISKLTVYAVTIGTAGAAARPQVFVCT
jgi:hypothetical protein